MFDINDPEKLVNEIMTVFPNYCRLWQQINVEYMLTPEWRMIRKQRLLNQMHKLTKEYQRWFEKMMYPKLEVKDDLSSQPTVPSNNEKKG